MTSMSRVAGAIVLPMALLFTISLAGSAFGMSCVAPSQTGETPEGVKQARDEILAYQPENPGGYVRLVEQLERNRRAFANGTMTAAEAEQQGGFALNGTRSIPVIPVLYSNTSAEPFNPAALQDLLFASWRNDSMTAYFNENSYDQFFLDGDVLGFEELDGTDFSYTGLNYGLDGGGADMVFEAAIKADSSTDYSLYDNDGPDGIPNSGDDDGFVDVLAVVHPEIGGECSGGDVTNIWSHHSYLSRHVGIAVPTNDISANGGPIWIDRYFVAPGLSCVGDGSMIEIGVICHEYGHALGIPDLYDTHEEGIAEIGDSQGLGRWGLMSSGNWNQPTSPAHMTAHTKHRLGWLDYFDVLQDGNLCLPPVETNPIAARVWTDGVYGPEYFLVENRQQIGFDQNLFSPGLVIYHVNDFRYELKKSTNRVNADETNKGIDVETADAASPGHIYEADGLDDAINGNNGDTGDVWCSGGWSEKFDANSASDSRAMNGNATGVAVRNIDGCTGDANGWICADFTVGVAQPVDLCIEDCPGDNCNDIATCEEWWATPNIWIDNEEDGIQDAPSWSIPNKVFYKVQNQGPDVAAGTEVSLYIAPGAMGLEWPQDASLVGTMTVPILEPGAAVKDHFVFTYPDLLELAGHWCMGIVVNHPQDLTTSSSASLTNNVAQVNEQILVARAGTPVEPLTENGDAGGAVGADGAADLNPDGIDGSGDYGEAVGNAGGPVDGSITPRTLARGGSCPGEMAQATKIYLLDGDNPFEKPLNVVVRVGTPPLFDDAVIPAHWDLTIDPGLGPYVVSPTMKDSITVKVSSAAANHGEFAHIPLTLWDIDTGKMIGGVVIDFSVDCYAPLPPDNLSADWIDFPGDNWGEHNVVVEWEDVYEDEQSNPEFLEHYEVYRSDDGAPEVLVDRVIVDGDPDLDRFQWYDYVPTVDCDTYVYRVRAIDRAGNVGAFSDTGQIDCAVANVPDGSGGPDDVPWVGLHRARALPSPFRETTEIEYQTIQSGEVEVAIFDATGKRLRLLDRREIGVGTHRVTWDGTDELGRQVPSGIYFYRVRGEGIAEMRKVVRSR